MKTLFVSVNHSFDPETGTSRDLRNATVHAWRVGEETVEECDHVVTVFHGRKIAAFELLGAIPNAKHPWDSTGHTKRLRSSLVLGEQVPVRPDWYDAKLGLRNGVTVLTF